MIWSLFKHELTLTYKKRRNVIFLISLLILLFIYALIILPNEQTPDTFDPVSLSNEVKEMEEVQENRENRGFTGFLQMAGMSPYAVDENRIKSYKRLIQSFEDDNFQRFLKLRMMNPSAGTSQGDIRLDYLAISPFTGKDSNHLRLKRTLRYHEYQEYQESQGDQNPITYSMLEQKTALQTLQRLLVGITAYLIIFIGIYFSSDIVVRDRENQTLLQGLPVSWYRTLNIKTLVSFFYTLAVISGLAVVGIILISVQKGFGYFDLPIPIFSITEWTFTFDDYEIIPLATFLGLAISFIPVIIYLFVRLSILLNLLLKNEWLVLIVSTFVLLSERIYFTRTKRELFGFDLSYFPQSYFEFGRVVSGEQNFLVNLDTITYGKGMVVLLITILVIECLVFLVSYVVTKRRFYN